jgi:hypothetical protein
MEFLINAGRLLMVSWVVYALLLIFAPQFIHRAPNPAVNWSHDRIADQDL